MKRFMAGMAVIAMCMNVTACGSNKNSLETTTQPVAEATTVALENDNFPSVSDEELKPMTQDEFKLLSDIDDLGVAMTNSSAVAGITNADINQNTQWEYGNFKNDSSVDITNISLTCRAKTPTGKTLDYFASYVKAQNPYGSNKDNHWTVASIRNAYNGHYYYVMDGASGQYDIYDFQTDTFKETITNPEWTNPFADDSAEATVTTTEAQQSTTEPEDETKTYKAVKKAEDFSPKVTFTEDMANDVTGRWRLAEIDKDIDIQNYAVSYYKTYFKDPSEVHIIINYSRNVTTCITSYGNLLYVDLYDLVSPADKDAKLSLSGTPLANYKVDLNTGKIEKIE